MHQRSQTRLMIVLLLNLLLIAALVIVGLSAHSVGVLATGVDYLGDASAIAVSLLAIRLARRPPTARRPHGYPDATNIAAAVNAGWLLVLNIGVIVAAFGRLSGGVPQVHGLPVLVVSGIAALVMLVGALILGGDLDDDDDADEGEDLNIKAVLLDTAADATAAAGVAIAGGLILAMGGWYWLDPAVALLIAIVVAYHAIVLIRKVSAAIKTTKPSTLDLEHLRHHRDRDTR